MPITYRDCPMTITVKGSEGDKEFTETYQQIVRDSVSVDDILTMLQNPETAKQVIFDWFYGQDLRAKAVVRNSILNKAAGPDRAFEKSVKDFIKLREANGKPISEERAREFVKLQMEME